MVYDGRNRGGGVYTIFLIFANFKVFWSVSDMAKSMKGVSGGGRTLYKISLEYLVFTFFV